MSLEKTQDELGRAVSTHEEFGGEGVSLKAVKTPIFKHYVRCTQSFTEQQVPACRRLNFELSLSCAAHEHTESQTHRARGAQLLRYNNNLVFTQIMSQNKNELQRRNTVSGIKIEHDTQLPTLGVCQSSTSRHSRRHHGWTVTCSR